MFNKANAERELFYFQWIHFELNVWPSFVGGLVGKYYFSTLLSSFCEGSRRRTPTKRNDVLCVPFLGLATQISDYVIQSYTVQWIGGG